MSGSARYNFKQGYTYRLKLTHLPGFPGLELYPTLEVPGPSAVAAPFLSHTAVKLEITDDEVQKAVSGQFVSKAVYFPGNGNVATSESPLLILRLGNLNGGLPSGPGK